jgi:hypothetical protein
VVCDAVEGQKDDRPSRNAAHLAEPAAQVGPLVDGDGGHAGVERLVVEGEILRDGVDGGRQVGRALGAHDGGRLDSDDMAVERLVRAGSGADIEDGAGVAERPVDHGGDAGVGAALGGVAVPIGVVVEVAGASVRHRGAREGHGSVCAAAPNVPA